MTRFPLTPADRRGLLGHYRRPAEPDARLRAHILLPLDDGHPWATTRAVLFCSPATIGRWEARSEAQGVGAVLGRPRGRKRSGVRLRATLVVRWVLTPSPTHSRIARSRWGREAAAVVLREDYRVTVGRGTVRRWLREADRVWRRPRPTTRPKDPDREKNLRALRALLHRRPADETAVFQDEVDVNPHPRVGCQWMNRGEQAATETPGSNQGRYPAGSIHWRTGRVILTEGRPKEGRGAALVCRPPDDLRRASRQYRLIHVICDNAGADTPGGSKLVRAYPAGWGHRVKVHYLPTYAPDTNPIERVWWRRHEAVTRNHRCKTADELLDLTFDWFETRTDVRVQSQVDAETPGK